MNDSQVLFKMITNNLSSNPIPKMVVPFLFIPLHKQENVKRGIVKGYREQLRNFKHKGNIKLDATPNIFQYSLPIKYKGDGTRFQVQLNLNQVI